MLGYNCVRYQGADFGGLVLLGIINGVLGPSEQTSDSPQMF